MKGTILAAAAGLIALAAFDRASASGESTARTLAMGGSTIALASGVHAAKTNPANLALSGYRNSGLELVGLSTAVHNNAFTLDDYNEYTGAYLDAQDKATILSRIPESGLTLRADVEASALSLSLGSTAISAGAVGTADITLSKDIVDLLLNGVQFGDTVSLNGMNSEGISYAFAGLSHGFSLYKSGTRQLAVGITAKYLHGLAVQEVTQLRGSASTAATGFAGDGAVVSRTALGGSGFAIDLGTSLRLSKEYTVAATLANAYGTLRWNRDTREQGYLFAFDTATIDNFDEDYVLSDDYDSTIGSFSTSLPRTLTVGFARTTGLLKWEADWIQGLSNDFSASTSPAVAVGTELSLVPFLPLRAGYRLGGDRPSAFSFGAGLRLLGFYLDAGAVTGKSVTVYSSTGAHVAVSTGFAF